MMETEERSGAGGWSDAAEGREDGGQEEVTGEGERERDRLREDEQRVRGVEGI